MAAKAAQQAGVKKRQRIQAEPERLAPLLGSLETGVGCAALTVLMPSEWGHMRLCEKFNQCGPGRQPEGCCALGLLKY